MLSHDLRHLPPRLTFDVRQNNKNMKTPTSIILIGLLAVGCLRAADVPERDFPYVGATYSVTQVGESKPITLRIEKVLPSGWIYATEFHKSISKDPSDETKLIETHKAHGAAWYNLNTFTKASEIKDKN